MSLPARAILIDPMLRSITAVTLTNSPPGTELARLKQFVGTDNLSCSRLPNGDTGWYDDNGLFVPWTEQAFFTMPGFSYPLAGRWLITRYDMDDEGEEALQHCRTELDFLNAMVGWIDAQAVAIPSPTVATLDKEGNTVSVRVLDGGDGVWTFENQPRPLTL